MKFNLLKSSALMLAAIAGSLSMSAAWVEVKSWDFAALTEANDDKTVVTYSDDTVTVGVACNLGTDSYDGLAFQGAGSWFTYKTSGGLYQGNGGGRVVAVLDLAAEDKVVFTANAGDKFYDPINGELESTDTDEETGRYSIIYSVTEDGNFGVYLTRYYSIYSITVLRNDGQGQEAEVTLNYVCNGESIKTETKKLEVGSEVTLTASEKADFTDEGVKYIYVSDDSADMIVAAEGTVVTLTYRVADTYNWTVNTNVDGTVEKLDSGISAEGDDVTVAYPRYILSGSTLWLKDAISSQYSYTFTPDKDDFVVDLEYTETTITNVIYYSEAEDIDGLTATEDGQIAVRGSNCAGAYSEEAVEVYTLQPGTYQVHIAVCGNSGETIVVKAGEEEVLSGATVGYWNPYSSDEFTVAEETVLTVEGGGSQKPLDFIYITADEATVGVAAVEAADAEGEWYNLQGMKVAAPAKGIYIHNGKKVVVK